MPECAFSSLDPMRIPDSTGSAIPAHLPPLAAAGFPSDQSACVLPKSFLRKCPASQQFHPDERTDTPVYATQVPAGLLLLPSSAHSQRPSASQAPSAYIRRLLHFLISSPCSRRRLSALSSTLFPHNFPLMVQRYFLPMLQFIHKLELISISILLFCSTGIISAGQMHLYPALLLHRDYFHRPDSSLSRSFVPQGLFPPTRCIPSLLFSSTGIISTGQMHPSPALFHHRDYFDLPDSSLACCFLPQGLFPPAGFISSLLFSSTGIISTGQMHPSPALFHHRDYFSRSDTSPIAESISARPFHQIQSDMKLSSPNPGQSSEMRTGYPYASNRIPASSLAPCSVQ